MSEDAAPYPRHHFTRPERTPDVIIRTRTVPSPDGNDLVEETYELHPWGPDGYQEGRHTPVTVEDARDNRDPELIGKALAEYRNQYPKKSFHEIADRVLSSIH